MKTFRIFSLAVVVCLSMNVMAQGSLTEAGRKAQKSLVDYLRVNMGLSPSIDTKDNSVTFRQGGVLFWVTFDEDSPVRYTIHRKGLKFDDDPSFKPSIARAVVNDMNGNYHVKSVLKGKRVDFILETYAKEPADFHGGLRKMLAAFRDIDNTFKTTYERGYENFKRDSLEEARRTQLTVVPGASPLTVSYAGFGNFDAAGNMISDYDQPLRKNALRYIKTSIDVTSTEKGLFKVGIKVYTPDGNLLKAASGMDYAATGNVEIKKAKKAQELIIDPFGSDDADFWKAGEYKVQVFDFEKGALIYETTFNVL